MLLTFFPQNSDFTKFFQALFENDAFDFFTSLILAVGSLS